MVPGRRRADLSRTREGSFVLRHTALRKRQPRENPMLDDTFHVYDTPLRDGAQQEGLNLTVADKLVIARQLDELGVGFIEGGWPGAIPRDTEFCPRRAA